MVSKRKLFFSVFASMIMFSFIFYFSFVTVAVNVEVNTNIVNLTADINNGQRHYAFGDCKRMPNGDLLLVYANGTGHSSASALEARISSDDAVTWSEPFLIEPHDGKRYADAAIGLTDNGSVIVTYQAVNTGSKGKWSINYHNGSDGFWIDKGYIWENNIKMCSCVKTINHTTYATCRYQDPNTYQPNNGDFALYLYTLDSGDSGWTTIWNNAIDTWNDTNELTLVNLSNENFLAYSRNYLSSFNSTFQLNSTDNGSTWSIKDGSDTMWNRTDIRSIANPQVDWLNYEDRVLILHGANPNYPTCDRRTAIMWVSTDDGVTWTNLTYLMPYPSIADSDAGYSGFAHYEGEKKGFIVWYWGEYGAFDTTNMYGRWVYDNTTYVSEGSLEILSIDGNTNGTTLYESTPTINWSVVSDASQYWLQIATDSDFTSLEVNLTDINQWNYPSNCDINETRVSFTLPTALSSYDRYYVRAKVCVKN